MTEPSPDPATVARVAEIFAAARSVLFVTGAGVSADSGLPTYRGVAGLYERGATEEGFAIEEALSGEMMAARPELVWKYLRQIESACRGARPSRGHEVMALCEARFERCCVLTQNVDGLHGAAGSRNVIEIHGSMRRLRCTRCPGRHAIASFAELPELPALPRCAACGAPERPDVVLFGEMLPPAELERLQGELDRGFELCVVAGTSAVFPYVQAPVVAAARAGLPTVEINPERTVLSALVTHRLACGAAAALDAVWRALAGSEGAR